MTHGHGGRIYEYAEKVGVTAHELLDFSANMNPLGPPAAALVAVWDHLPEIRHYPDARHRAVREAIGERFDLPIDSILCTNGAAEAIDIAIRYLLPGTVWIFEPAFAEYAHAAARSRCRIERLYLSPDANWNWFDVLYTAAVRPGDMIVLNNPHNPTGAMWTRAQVEMAIRFASERRAWLLVDESFLDFRDDEANHSVLSQAVVTKDVLVVRSATKIYAIPGLRFGFLAGHPSLIREIAEHRDPWSVNQLAQRAAAAAYRDGSFLKATHAWLARERAWVHSTWGRHKGVQLYPPSANYAFCRLADEIPVAKMLNAFAARGMFVRSCANYHGLNDHHIRFAIRLRTDNERLYDAFCSFLAAL
ncbi:L-threonine O-3-phosphate decarboxylase [Alicyclobacillus sacchari]|uniref:threonine-phosphate decarboxylase n=1 Tax=Alicyclobacillus sacchari TaxID=392010 RepID=A0A4R8LVF0_9BACL|nr:threonine-phosphate decarboxylase CobD [Alicyclobacillus sacchari]TDY50636.1 L-threonine O-3-phosphate decarboxylase [Alicyclobacillus sacchari]GMA55603.1 threonine-phosphate decarboxylase [Alicyclobacillus sacchari]